MACARRLRGLDVSMHWRRDKFQRLMLRVSVLAAAGLIGVSARAEAALDEAQKLFLTGDYPGCLAKCEKAASEDFHAEDWALLHTSTLLTLGRYSQAEGVLSNGLEHTSSSIRLRWIGIESARFAGQTNVARRRLDEINELVRSRPWAYREAADQVALGRLALLLRNDPKAVMERLYNPAQKADPELRDPWLASTELALEKHDFGLAAKTGSEGLKKLPEDPDLLCLVARAYEGSAPAKAQEMLKAALARNPRHFPTLLELADHAINAEEYEEAEKVLKQVFAVNPWQPRAWAYRAVLAHLRNDPAAESAARANGLKFWTANPEVDHVIGLKLSQNYRFSEGAAHQRQALAFDEDYLAARIQLAHDLLRLGEEAEGWQLAEAVNRRDGYDVTAYNLVGLHRTMDKFATLTNAEFVLRMGANEAPLYGDRALDLLARARARLTEKYGVTLAPGTIVEIFPDQKDFGVRTFGMPHNPGFLGVCFGHVVTANSPASQGGSPANWEAVLWHEFCHVVTLQLTHNKMPRWLSEGISVYEEIQANPAWGQTMTPRYREMVLGEELTPVSQLSSAFLTPKSDLHVQFAYYESELVVEYLVGKFGFEKLVAILRDLGAGTNINDAIAKHTAPLQEIEAGFEKFARARAEALGSELDWKKPESLETSAKVANRTATKLDAEAAAKSKNYWMLLDAGRQAIAAKDWEAAKAPLRRLLEFYPNATGPNNPYALLAAAYRGLNETAEEQKALEKWAELDADTTEAYARLMELAETAKDWKGVALNAGRFLAVNPLGPQPYRFLARASEALGATGPAIEAYRKLLLLEPADPADVHFRLARLLHQNRDDATARRQVLEALEEAPRFREAHRLLLELAQANPAATNRVTPAAP